jgi:hypothetical protein
MSIEIAGMPWWGWLLCGAGGGIGTLMTSRIVRNTKDGKWAFTYWLVSILAGIGGFICFVIGLVGLTKWALS